MKDKDFNKLEQKNLKSICRLCLIDGQYLREMFGTKIPSMIQYSLDIKIVPHNQLSTHICTRCFRQIINFYTFKRKVERNDRVLKKAVRHRSKQKDIINIALEQSDINPSELNETEADTITCSVAKKGVKLRNKKGVRTDNELEEPQNKNKVVNFYNKPLLRPEHCNEIQDLSVKPNLDLGTSSLCFNYDIELPPLVPLQSNSDTRNSKSILGNTTIDLSVSKSILSTSSLQPPPLISIIPNIASQFVERTTVSSTTLFCSICKKEFESLTDLQEHKLRSNCKLNACNICTKSFMDRKKLIVHLKGHKITKEYLCNLCGKSYSSPSTYSIHFRSHTGEKPFKCSICGKGFVRWAGVKNHMVTHEDFKPYKCETCGKQFKVISNLYRHKRLHTGNYTFSCNFCNKAFYQSDHLKLHVRTYHTNEKPYLCCECGKGFVSFQRLKRHELVHSGEKPYPCALCYRAYSNAVDLKNHTLKVHDKNGNGNEIKKYACSVCGLRFWHPCRLTKHMTTHAHINKNCQTCGHNFKCVQELTRHLKTSSCKNIAVEGRPLLK